MNQNPTSNIVQDRQFDVVQKFITTQNFGYNRRRINGIRVEYFARIHYIGACPRSPKGHEHNQNNLKDELSSRRCSMSFWGEMQTKKNVLLIPHVCLYSQKDFQQDVGHSSDWDQWQGGVFLTKKDLEENGIESLNWWWSNSEKADTQFPEHRVRFFEEWSNQRRWRIICTLLCRWGNDSHLCFRTIVSVNQSVQYLRSSLRFVWWIQGLSIYPRETCCGRGIRPTFLASRLIDNDTHIFGWDSCTRKSFAEAQKKRGKHVTTRSIDESLYWCRIPILIDEFWQFAKPVTCRCGNLCTNWRWFNWRFESYPHPFPRNGHSDFGLDLWQERPGSQRGLLLTVTLATVDSLSCDRMSKLRWIECIVVVVFGSVVMVPHLGLRE